jgi:hypothetical protein
MVDFLEQLLHDTLWEWLRRQDRYCEIGSEITLGGSGRIDLLAKTTDSLLVGFEVKADVAFSEGRADGFDLSKQLSKYASSGYLDELYYVSPDVSVFEELGDYVTDRIIRRKVYMGFGWSLYEDGFEDMPSPSTDSSLAVEVHGVSEERFNEWREKIQQTRKELKSSLPEHFVDQFEMDQFMSKVAKHAKDDPNSRSFDYDVLSFEDVIEELLQLQVETPQEVGTIEIPFELAEPQEPNYRLELQDDPEDLFSKPPNLDVTISQRAERLNRMNSVEIPSDNEAWVQHHVWREMGNIREGYIPVGNGKSRQIDVIGFSGGIHPTDVLENGGELIGIEAKDGKLPKSRHKKITEQLVAYHESGALSQVYLAVPAAAKGRGELLLHNGPDKLNDVGMITVDLDGRTKIRTPANELELKYDGYRTSQGYLRAVAFGRLKIQEADQFISILDS